MRKETKIVLAFSPILILLFIFYIWPLFETIKYTVLRNGEFIGLERFFTIVGNKEFVSAFLTSTKIAVISVIISAILAIIISLALRDTKIGKGISVFLYQTNISIPHVAIATMVVMLFSQTGLLSSIAYSLGLIDNWYEFPLIIKDSSLAGVVISYVLKFTPFIGISVLAILQTNSREYEHQSRVLGVGRYKTFFHITLPSIMPAVSSMGLIVFAFAFGCYEVPTILTAKMTLPGLIYNSYYDIYNPEGMEIAYAGAIIVALVTITVAILYLLLEKRRSRYE